MAYFSYDFSFSDVEATEVVGYLELEDPIAFLHGSAFYRPGRIALEGCGGMELVLYHSPSTAAFMYMRDVAPDANLLELVGLTHEEISRLSNLPLPGQLCLGSDRAQLIRQAIKDVFGSPALYATISTRAQQNLAVFPIAREGLKYEVTEAIFENYGYYCDEVVLDAHHVFDSSVPVYNRKVEMTIFKDKDLDKLQRENISIAFIADSIASGLVMRETIERVKERFPHIQEVNVICPLATVRGLCRIGMTECLHDTKVRLHVFETLLNALPPDYYYSAHFSAPEFHIRPDLDQEYRQWWGQDSEGNYIADTACAGYGWSEVFYSPRKQIQMINSQLEARHNLTIADIVRRHI
ncbi:MAG TPA: hypothetical protein VF313_06940 [Anaerolineaceae bacterium]